VFIVYSLVLNNVKKINKSSFILGGIMRLSKLLSVFVIFGLLAFSFQAQAASGAMNKLKKKYYVDSAINGFHSIRTKRKPQKYGIADINGRIIIEPQFGNMSSVYSCGKVLAGNAWYQMNDYGAQEISGIKTPKVIDITTGKTIKRLSIHAKAPFYSAFRPFEGTRLIDDSGKSQKYSLYNPCTDKTTATGFEHIKLYSKEGYAMGRIGTEYTVFDKDGNELLPRRFRLEEHGAAVKANRKSVFAMSDVKNGKVLASYDALKWGVYDVVKQQLVLPMEYDYIGFYSGKLRPNDKEETDFYSVAKNGKANLINEATGQELIPSVFDILPDTELRIIHSKNNKSYVFGAFKTSLSKPKHKYVNAYDIATGSYLFPQEIKPQYFSELEENNYVVTKFNGDKAIADSNGEFKTHFRPKMNKFIVRSVEKDGVSYPFYMMQKQVSIKQSKKLKRQGKQGNVSYIFDNQKRLLLEGSFIIHNVRAKDGMLVVREGKVPRTPGSARTKLGKTCISTDYDIVGPRFLCGQPVTVEHVVDAPVEAPVGGCDKNIADRKSNLTKSARVKSSSRLCKSIRDNCYKAETAADGNTNTAFGPQHSWASDQKYSRLDIDFRRKQKTVEQIEVYTTKNAPIKDYDVIVRKNGIANTIEKVRGNKDEYNCHSFGPYEGITEVQIRVLKGPDKEPNIMRLNEVLVY